MTIEGLTAKLQEWLGILQGWAASPQFYAQLIAIAAAWIVAKFAARQILLRVSLFATEPTEGRFLRYQRLLHSCRSGSWC